MGEYGEILKEWRSAGLISAQQVKNISTYEKSRQAAATPGGRGAPVAEAIGYVGAAIALAAVGLLLGDRWDTFNAGGRLAVVGLLTVVAAGAAIVLRANPHAAIQRLVSVLGVGALAGAAWLTVIATTEWTDWRPRDIALTVALVVAALAIPLYWVRPRALPQLAAFVSILVLVGTVFARSAFSGGVPWSAVAIWAVACAWILLALGDWLEPRDLAVFVGSAVAIIAGAIAASGDGRPYLLWVGLAVAVAMSWRGVAADETLLVAFGAIGVLVFVPQIVLEIFPEGSAAIVAMLVVGLLLVVIATWIARGRRARTRVRP